MKLTWLKISHHKHSGKLRPHEYTSYLPLALLLLVVGFALTVYTVSASPGPGAGSVALSGTMPGPAPTVGATITNPVDGQHFSTSPVSVEGTCPTGTLVEIFKNDIFAGSTTCTSSGDYSLKIDLLVGQNQLIARDYDALNQAGPDSKTVTVYYDALPPQPSSLSPLNFGGAQLLLETNAVYRGTFPGQSLSIPITILGGVPPYAINIEWGDSANSVVPRNDNLTFNVNHIYQKAGTYQITLQGTDAKGRTAFLTVAAIVNGQPSVSPVSITTKSSGNTLLLLWPLYAIAATMLISFWLGERREKHILINSGGLRPHPQA